MKLFLEKSHQLNLVNYFCKTTPSLTFERDLNAPPHIPENLLVLCQKPETFNMERFAKLVDGFQLLTIFSKRSILDAQHGSEYTCGFQISDIRHESKRTYSFFTNADIKPLSANSTKWSNTLKQFVLLMLPMQNALVISRDNKRAHGKRWVNDFLMFIKKKQNRIFRYYCDLLYTT